MRERERGEKERRQGREGGEREKLKMSLRKMLKCL
jgi:hypothetical protein